jgi:hypothetical protein
MGEANVALSPHSFLNSHVPWYQKDDGLGYDVFARSQFGLQMDEGCQKVENSEVV